MKDINIEAILDKHLPYPLVDHTTMYVKAAIKEIVEAVIDKCWQKSRIEVRGIHNREINFEAEDINTLTLKDEAVFVDVKESSILKVKEMINYGI